MVSQTKSQQPPAPRIYDGDGDALMARQRQDPGERIQLVPDALPSKQPDPGRHLRILWGQHLLEDLLLGRYRTLVCAVNGRDNSHGIVSQLAAMLPTSQWDERSITAYAAQFSAPDGRVKVLKFDMDAVEVLGILRPANSLHLTLEHLTVAFRVIAQMVRHRSTRSPSASVSFLGARANALMGPDGREPTFESVLRVMHEAGYTGDVYPSPAMWMLSEVGVFPRYPFSSALDQMRAGGY